MEYISLSFLETFKKRYIFVILGIVLKVVVEKVWDLYLDSERRYVSLTYVLLTDFESFLPFDTPQNCRGGRGRDVMVIFGRRMLGSLLGVTVGGFSFCPRGSFLQRSRDSNWTDHQRVFCDYHSDRNLFDWTSSGHTFGKGDPINSFC